MLGLPSCTPLRRHSWSAPPRLLLDGCLVKVALLSERVDRVTDKLRSRSFTDLTSEGYRIVGELVDQLLSFTVKKGECKMVKPRQCHHCHRTLDHPEHAGIGSGMNHCTLDHYGLCPGGRQTSVDWTGCPASLTDGESESEVLDQDKSVGTPSNNGFSMSGNMVDDMKSKIDKPSLDPAALAHSLEVAASQADRVELDVDEESSDDDEEEKILQEEVARLKIQVEEDEAKLVAEKKREDDARLKAEKKAQKLLNRQRLEKEKAELLRRAKGQKKLVTSPVDRSLAQNFLPSPPRSSTHAGTDHLHREAGNLAARQQQQAANRRQARTGADQLTMGGIRSLPGMTADVEKLLVGLQAMAPSLAKEPTAPSATGPTFQPTGVLSSGPAQRGEEYDTDYVFNPAWGKYVKVVHSPVRESVGVPQQTVRAGGIRTNPHGDPESGAETSEDEDCPMEPQKGYRFVWKRDTYGDKYFIQELAKKSSPEIVQTYVCDEATGRWYKRSVPKADLERSKSVPVVPEKNRQAKTTPAYKDHRQGELSPVPLVRRGVRTPTPSAPLLQGDRVAGIVPIDSEKQGRDTKIPDRVQWARNCPVNWTNKVTSANLNIVLWAWSYVAELLATRTGMAPNLESGELEARLQHFCHVLEITLQTSSQADFSGDSWAVAHLYDRKVQQKVDSRMFSWVQLADMNHGASLPHELIAATQSLENLDRSRRSLGQKRFTTFG